MAHLPFPVRTGMEPPTAVRVLHDLGLAVWFGGSLMGAVGLNGATIEVDDHTQRIRVADAGWFRWAPLEALSILGHLGAAVALGRLAAPGRKRSGWNTTRVLVTGAAVTATVGTGVVGQRVMRAGDVPVATAVKPIEATPEHVARAQRWLRTFQWVVPILTGALWVVDELQQRPTN